jgi:probable HAF family extracellular repeat protein
MRSLCFALLTILLCTSATRAFAGASLTPLGDLPGGGSYSWASGISADGSVVVGSSDSASGREAFRWTRGGGMVGLGDLPGGLFGSTASGVSADGSVVVGSSDIDSAFQHAFRWTR